MNKPPEILPYARVQRARRGSWRVNLAGVLMCVALFGDVLMLAGLPNIHNYHDWSRRLTAECMWLLGAIPSGCATLVVLVVACVAPLPRTMRPESTQLRVLGYLAAVNAAILIGYATYAMWPIPI